MWLLLLAILSLAGCATAPGPCPRCPEARPPEQARYEEASFASLPGWVGASVEPSLRAFLASCQRVAAAAPLARACEQARGVPAGDEAAARRFFESAFTPYSVRSSETGDTGQVTGYYEPVLAGSRASQGPYRYPIFAAPDDLLIVDLASVYPELSGMRLRGRLDGRRVVPYWTRGEIDAPNSRLAAPVIAWAADPVEVFFLQIQGSGQIELEDGSRLRVGFAEQNGHPYRSVGRTLVERGDLTLDGASMQGIKAWAASNPDRFQEALNTNASYVFFRELPPGGNPVGALNVALTPGYSAAVDRRFIPLGAPVFLATTQPASTEPLERLMVAQDVGGAIRGALRMDFYWGTGPAAGASAGRMRQSGKLWLLWPRGVPPPARPQAAVARNAD